MRDKKVSLIIPVYNTAAYLRRCINSVLSQTYDNMEIICVDDGSTDGSGEILDEFAQCDKRIFAIHQKNSGESSARNTALSVASGDYIGFVDCDDWIEPEMYEVLATSLENADADIAVSAFYREFEEGEKRTVRIWNEKTVEPNTFDGKQLLRYLYERDAYRSFAYIWDKLYKREVIYRNGRNPIFFDENLELGGDVLWLAKCALNIRRAVYVEDAFYHYLWREGSGCHMPDLKRRLDNITAYQIVLKEFEEKNVESVVVDYIKRILVYHGSNTAQLAYELKNRVVLKQCQELMRKFEKEYRLLNTNKLEWIKRFEDILQYEV